MSSSIIQKLILLITILAVIFFAGLKTTLVRKTGPASSLSRVTLREPALTLYGRPILTSENAGRFYGLIQIGHDKYWLILATLLVGFGSFGLTLSKK